MKNHIPQHVAIIMDGNRRWAKERNLPPRDGHQKGINNVKNLIESGHKLGIKTMTFYCFSTENWKRSKMEVSYLMKLFTSYIKDNLQELHQQNVRIRHVGRQDRLPKSLLKVLQEAEAVSRQNQAITVNLAIDYGGRDEILRAAQKIVTQNQQPQTEEDFARLLDTAPNSNVDLLIRTSGEKRLSNYLLWELAYAELFFEETYFPDVSVELFEKIIDNYARRNRRIGR